MATKFKYDNQFGDELTDKHSFMGIVDITGSLAMSGAATFTGGIWNAGR